MKKTLSSFFLLLFALSLFAQKDFYQNHTFTKADTLRGMLRPERTCYDVTFYDLNLAVDIEKRFLKGFVDIHFDALENFTTMQIDLYKNMEISEITYYDKTLTFKRLFNAVFVYLPKEQKHGTSGSIRVFFEGYPTAAQNAPWDGGFVWKKDAKGTHWVGVACEGDGASLWWPNKDHLSDEPDSMAIRVSVPKDLYCVANGNLRNVSPLGNGYNRYEWFVSYPINNYNVSINIADYSHFSDTYIATDGDSLAIDYYVLSYNLEKAKTHFQQVPEILACYERYFGKYPFWNDGLAFVETPYLGMEHQSAIAYGNNYTRGYLGGMIPRDMDWDFIIVHELGHEWFGNSVSIHDHAEMWIHESFTTYMEALYVECRYSYADAIRYLNNQKSFIHNREPILGPKEVNWGNWSSSDHYFKGSWVLHTLRHAINDDEQWWAMLRGLYDKFAINHATTQEIIDYINTATSRDWTFFFEQYLQYPTLPKLLYQLDEVGPDLKVSFQWETDVAGFDMPILVGSNTEFQLINPVTTEVRSIVLKNKKKTDFQVATDLFYIRKRQMKLVETP